MTIQRPDPNKPLFADIDEADEDQAEPKPVAEAPAPIRAEPMGVNPGAGAAIPLGAPADAVQDEGVERDEPDPRGR